MESSMVRRIVAQRSQPGRKPLQPWEEREKFILELLEADRPFSYIHTVSGWSHTVVRGVLERMKRNGLVKMTGKCRGAKWARA